MIKQKKIKRRIPKWLAITFLVLGIIFLLGGTTGEVDMLIIGTVLTALAIVGFVGNRKKSPKTKLTAAQPVSVTQQEQPVPQHNIQQPTIAPPSKKSKSPLSVMRDILIIIVLLPIALVIVVVWFVVANHNPEADGNQRQAAQQTVEQQAEDEAAAREIAKTLIEGHVPRYCETHREKRVPLPYQDGDEWKYNVENPKVSVTEEDCRSVITYLVNNVESSAANLERVSNGEISIGMNRHELLMSWGVPSDVNSTHTTSGSRDQYVYGNPIYGASYVYLDNDVITAIQN